MGLAIIVPGISFDGSLGKVTFSGDIPVSSILIDEGTPVRRNKTQYGVFVSPSNASDKRVSWSIVSGGQYATVDSEGIVTVLDGASSSSVTLRATSVSDPSVYGEKSITVTYDPGETYDYLYSKDSLSGTATDCDVTSIALHSDANSKWTMFVLIPQLSVAGTAQKMATIMSANQQAASPYDGLSIATQAGVIPFPGIVTENNVKYYFSPITGEVTTATYPEDTPDGKSHCVAISRDGTLYKFSLDGTNWTELCVYNPTNNAKSAVMVCGGVIISGTTSRYPTATSPAVVALKIGTSEYAFADLFSEYGE